MRQLVFSDVYKMSKILSKLEIKLDKDAKTVTQLGVGAMLKIAENLHLAEKEVNEFIGSLIGIPGKEFGELPFSKAKEYYDEFKELDGIKDFFQVSKSIDEIDSLDLLLSRYSNIEFVMTLTIEDGVKLLVKAYEERTNERLLQRWMIGGYDREKSFEEFKSDLIAHEFNSNKTNEEILEDVRNIIDSFNKKAVR